MRRAEGVELLAALVAVLFDEVLELVLGAGDVSALPLMSVEMLWGGRDGRREGEWKTHAASMEPSDSLA